MKFVTTHQKKTKNISSSLEAPGDLPPIISSSLPSLFFVVYYVCLLVNPSVLPIFVLYVNEIILP